MARWTGLAKGGLWRDDYDHNHDGDDNEDHNDRDDDINNNDLDGGDNNDHDVDDQEKQLKSWWPVELV